MKEREDSINSNKNRKFEVQKYIHIAYVESQTQN